MEVLDLRLISSKDLQPLLEEERRVWRDTLRWDYSSTEAMVLRFMGVRALMGYAMLDGRRVIGYSFYVIEAGKGLIGDAFMHPEYRDGSHEVRLMTHVLETLQAIPGLRRIEAQLLNLDVPAVREQFHSAGFRGYDRQFLYLSIPDAGVATADTNSGMNVIEWNSRWFPAAASLILESYRGHVDSEISDQYRTRAGAVRFLENIIRLPGCGKFLPEASFLAVGEGGSEAVQFDSDTRAPLFGMVLTTVVSDRIAHITQLCVDPKHQGRGLGRRLIGRVTDVIRRMGFQGATLSVTVSNTAAIELYRSLGFIPLTCFPAFVWEAQMEAKSSNPRKTAARL